MTSPPDPREELAPNLGLERHYEADRDAMLAALRLALGLRPRPEYRGNVS